MTKYPQAFPQVDVPRLRSSFIQIPQQPARMHNAIGLRAERHLLIAMFRLCRITYTLLIWLIQLSPSGLLPAVQFMHRPVVPRFRAHMKQKRRDVLALHLWRTSLWQRGSLEKMRVACCLEICRYAIMPAVRGSALCSLVSYRP